MEKKKRERDRKESGEQSVKWRAGKKNQKTKNPEEFSIIEVKKKELPEGGNGQQRHMLVSGKLYRLL